MFGMVLNTSVPAGNCMVIVTAITLVLVSLLITLIYFTPCSSVSIVNFEHIDADWAVFDMDKAENRLEFSQDPYFNSLTLSRALCRLTFVCSKLTIETLEKGVKYLPS